MPIIIPPSAATVTGTGLTYLELQAAVLFNTLGERFRAPVRDWLNDAVRDVCRRLRIQKTACVGETDADGVVELSTIFWNVAEVYTMPNTASIGEVSESAIEQAASRRLSPIDAATATQLVPNVGTSYGYEAISRNGAISLRAVPTPVEGSLIAVVGHAFPTAMSADGDYPGTLQELDEALIAFCRARAFRREDDLQMASMWDQEYINRLRGVLPQHIQNTDGPRVTPGTDGYGDPWSGGG